MGEWARIWPLQTLIRSLGAYFVRRRSGDPLYRRVLARYVQAATTGGVVQAVYPEGNLSRDGRLRQPRLGLISYMLSAFDPDGERDLVFIRWESTTTACWKIACWYASSTPSPNRTPGRMSSRRCSGSLPTRQA